MAAAAASQPPANSSSKKKDSKSRSKPEAKLAKAKPKTPSSKQRSASGPETADSIPTPEELAASESLPVYDSNGQAIPFKNLHSGAGRHLIIWVRHFFCGMCQDYVRNLSELLTPAYLESLSEPTDIVIIGCGTPDLIDSYAEFCGGCPYPIYADPDRATHDNFQMVMSLSMGPKNPDYVTSNLVHSMCRSIWQGITSGTLATNGGKPSQLGGEMLFENGNVLWCHRMQNTRDHLEPATIRKLLEI